MVVWEVGGKLLVCEGLAVAVLSVTDRQTGNAFKLGDWRKVRWAASSVLFFSRVEARELYLSDWRAIGGL